MEGPSKADIQCEDNADGTCQVKYVPTEPGNYVVNIKFADEHIRGSVVTFSGRIACIDVAYRCRT